MVAARRWVVLPSILLLIPTAVLVLLALPLPASAASIEIRNLGEDNLNTGLGHIELNRLLPGAMEPARPGRGSNSYRTGLTPLSSAKRRGAVSG